jgi:lipoprotein-anchoring transpeptidase ErfK/SrfK
MRVSGLGLSIGGARFWRIGLFAMAGAIGLNSQAEAAIYYWSDSGSGFWQPAPSFVPQRRQRVRRHPDKKIETVEKEATKPQGPLIISISIAQQKMRIYDSNGLFAESPVSTGMPGHPTPMGVFSVIQKHKFHHSNIYSGAPMPFMQRITWSGVAIHAGVLPGHPASHGCIRMPMSFAVKMWNWTKMGARVIITPGYVTPASFSHPLLATLKVQPQPTATGEPKPDTTADAKVDKAVAPEINASAAIAQTKADARSNTAHDDGATPAAEEAPSSAPQTRTADAGSTSRATRPSATMSDAAHGDRGATQAAEQTLPETVGDSSKSEAKPEVEAKAGAANAPQAEPTKLEANKSNEKPAGVARPAAPPSVAIPEPNKDQNRPVDPMRAAAAKNDPAASSKRAGQIAAFVSRKDSKLYVRQNFAPLFELPVSISPDDRPLGTHVFTAQIDKDDANVLRWSVISLPAPSRHAERRSEDERGWRRGKVTGAAPGEAKASPEQDSPTEALNRIKLPADTMARIAESLSTGGSIIVSDQGIAAGETGEGTDFIVRLR